MLATICSVMPAQPCLTSWLATAPSPTRPSAMGFSRMCAMAPSAKNSPWFRLHLSACACVKRLCKLVRSANLPGSCLMSSPWMPGNPNLAASCCTAALDTVRGIDIFRCLRKSSMYWNKSGLASTKIGSSPVCSSASEFNKEFGCNDSVGSRSTSKIRPPTLNLTIGPSSVASGFCRFALGSDGPSEAAGAFSFGDLEAIIDGQCANCVGQCRQLLSLTKLE
mmetsp:Transcript_88624/g.255585  ORF Transcript_88624/g.255585 Transcript_88624/m.255585 type:complete len:222 (-) Transcript_88624:29-694(-)